MKLRHWLSNLMESRSRSSRRRRPVSAPAAEALEPRLMLSAITLELLHVTDQEGSSADFEDIKGTSAVLNALEGQDLGGDGLEDFTIRLSSGDAFLPGAFYDASDAVYGAAGIADILIQNELGFEAIALGNHEFDFGTGDLAELIDGSADGDGGFAGTAFPYLSANLDFSTDTNLASLAVAGGDSPLPNSVTSSVVIDVTGDDGTGTTVERIGVVGATTPTLASISSSGGVGIAPSPFDPTNDADIDALAAEIQAEVDALLATNTDVNKVILLSHMQQIDVEYALAGKLVNVDAIVAGGSNTRLFDDNDGIRDGDSDQGEYPQFFTNAGGTTTAVVNTDGSYKYVGRLVLDFDADGNIVPADPVAGTLAGNYDATVSGAYRTDAVGVENLEAEGMVDPEVAAIVDAIEQQIIVTQGNVFGSSDVFLNGNRSGVDTPDDPDGVRTQETNLGNLTADANLAVAKQADASVVLSLKNGGGIRASIGDSIVPPGGGTEAIRTPTSEIRDSDGNVVKEAGDVSQADIQKTLAFNNGLKLLTLTSEEIVGLLEHGVGAIPGVSGRFPQISGVKFSYDPSEPVGDRIVNAGIFDEDGGLIAVLVHDGEIVDPTAEFRIVTLDFLSAPRFDDEGNFIGAGDGYPFPNTNTDPSLGEVADPATLARINPVFLEQEGVQTGDATFADDGTEQDALAEYLENNFSVTPFSEEDTGRVGNLRIQNLAFTADSVFDGIALLKDDGTVVVNGTSENDVITVTKFRRSIVVRINGEDFNFGKRDVSRFQIDAKAGDDFVSVSERLRYDTFINAGDGNDLVLGGGGNDVILGSDGNDVILGRRGHDILSGGAGNDLILGGLGNDHLFGGPGFDLLFGGFGNDTKDFDGEPLLDLDAFDEILYT